MQYGRVVSFNEKIFLVVCCTLNFRYLSIESVFRVSIARYEHKGCWENSRQWHICPEFSQRLLIYQATIFNPIRNEIVILDSKIVLFLRTYSIGLAINYTFGFPCL